MTSAGSDASETADPKQLRNELVDKLVAAKTIRSPRIEAAFRAVPRHTLVSEHPLDAAYRDCALPTKVKGNEWLSSASQPSIVAIMLEQLDAQPGQRVLEIGAGVGYNAALLAEIVGDQGQVTTIEFDHDLAARARRNLDSIGLHWVNVLDADGSFGCPARAPYDRIILTAAARDIAPAWREQLAPDGRLVLPLSIGGIDLSVAFDREGDHLVSRRIVPCGFMRMRGSQAGKPGLLTLGPDPPVEFRAADVTSVQADRLIAALSAAATSLIATGITIAPLDVWPHLYLWLMLHDEQACDLRASGPAAERGQVPYLIGMAGKLLGTVGLFERHSLALLTRAPDILPPTEVPKELTPYELFIKSYGGDGAAGGALLERLKHHLNRWDAAGRPRLDRLSIRACARDATIESRRNSCLRDEPYTRFVFDFAAIE
jgi:protein-L-isoaspartate(D-aspartate) O-methyltransferase